MSRPIAVKGDYDDRGYVITSDVADDVKINGQPVALKGSKMDDGVAIVDEVSDNIRINGIPVALKGSKTEYHERKPRKGIGTIIQGSDGTNTGG